jgi:FkbM family methyltransferase
MLHWLADRAAAAPPVLKAPLYRRVWGRITRGQQFRVASNLGIDSRIRWSVPVDRAALAFGHPLSDETEASALRLVRALARGCDAFVDVGANRGLYSLWALWNFPRILAIEADPRLAAEFRSNIQRAGLDIQLIEAAVSDRRGSITFHADHDTDLMGSVLPVYSEVHRLQQIEVPAIDLASLLAEQQLQRVLMKIDVEGYGSTVWAGLRAAQHRVRGLLLEVTGPESQEGLPGRIIAETGWHAYYIRGLDLLESVDGQYEYVHPYWNWLFVPETAEALIPLLQGTGLRVHTTR